MFRFQGEVVVVESVGVVDPVTIVVPPIEPLSIVELSFVVAFAQLKVTWSCAIWLSGIAGIIVPFTLVIGIATKVTWLIEAKDPILVAVPAPAASPPYPHEQVMSNPGRILQFN